MFAAMRLVVQGGDGEMDLVLHRRLAGGDGVEPGLQRLQQFYQRLGLDRSGVGLQQIDELAFAGEAAQRVGVVADCAQGRMRGLFGPGRDHAGMQLGQLQPFAQGLVEAQGIAAEADRCSD